MPMLGFTLYPPRSQNYEPGVVIVGVSVLLQHLDVGRTVSDEGGTILILSTPPPSSQAQFHSRGAQCLPTSASVRMATLVPIKAPARHAPRAPIRKPSGATLASIATRLRALIFQNWVLEPPNAGL